MGGRTVSVKIEPQDIQIVEMSIDSLRIDHDFRGDTSLTKFYDYSSPAALRYLGRWSTEKGTPIERRFIQDLTATRVESEELVFRSDGSLTIVPLDEAGLPPREREGLLLKAWKPSESNQIEIYWDGRPTAYEVSWSNEGALRLGGKGPYFHVSKE